MKITDLIERELEVLEALRKRALDNDNEAAKVYLEHLRRASEDISKWQKTQDEKKPTK